jgi:curved DNA-binding protein
VDKDLYEVLGVNPQASEKDIRKAFLALAKKYHPDVNPGDKQAEQKFKEVNFAYEVLKDSKKRAQYDQMRSLGANPFARGGSPGGRGRAQEPYGQDFYAEFGLGDLFEEIFGGGSPFGRGRRGRSPSGAPFQAKGSDLNYQITVSFIDSVRGAEKSIALPSNKRLTVKIPEGIESGTRIKLSGQGNPGVNGGPSGDLVLEVLVEPHGSFRREGKDIYSELPISFSEAVLGAEVEVPTVDGKVFMKIPAGMSSGQRLKLGGKGVKSTQNVYGDHFVTVQIRIPKVADAAYVQAAELIKNSNFNPRQ